MSVFEWDTTGDDEIWAEKSGDIRPHDSVLFPVNSRPHGADFVSSKWEMVQYKLGDFKNAPVPMEITNGLLTIHGDDFLEVCDVPSMMTVSDSGATLFYARDEFNLIESFTNNRIGPFGYKLTKLEDDGTVKTFTALNKRIKTVLFRPVPVARKMKARLIPGELIFEVEGDPTTNIIGARPAIDFVRKPDELIFLILPDDIRLDGCITLKREVILDGVEELVARMVAEANRGASNLNTRSAIRRTARARAKVQKVATRLRKAALWSIRIVDERFIKGDAILTKEGFKLSHNVDGYISAANVKEEFFSLDGNCYILADAHHDSRKMRTSDRQSLGVFGGIIDMGHMQKGFKDASARVKAEIVTGRELSFMEEDDDRLDIDSLSIYEAKVEALDAANVLLYSVTGTASKADRFKNRFKPKHDTEWVGDEFREVPIEDSRRFLVPGLEDRSIKPECQFRLAGYLTEKDPKLNPEDWVSTTLGAMMNTDVFVAASPITGGHDQDDTFRHLHFIALYDAIVPLPGGGSFNVQAGEIVTLIRRFPQGVHSDNTKLGFEYFMLKPVPAAAARIRKTLGENLLTLDIDSFRERFPRVDELNYPACPADCEGEHPFGHPTWEPEERTFSTLTDYDISVAVAQFNSAAKVRNTVGGIGGFVNIAIICAQHNIVMPWRNTTEVFVDAVTKTGLTDKSLAEMARFQAEDRALIKRVSNGYIDEDGTEVPAFQIDSIAFKRIRSAYPFPAHGVGVTAKDRLFPRITKDHREILGEYARWEDTTLKVVRKRMTRLTRRVPVTIVSVRNDAGVLVSTGKPALIRKIDVTRDRLLAAKEAAGMPRRLTSLEFEDVGDEVVEYMESRGMSHDAMKASVLEALTWIYRQTQRIESDQALLNGALLEITVEVLKDLRAGDSNPPAAGGNPSGGGGAQTTTSTNSSAVPSTNNTAGPTSSVEDWD